MKILVVRLSALGDVLLTTPALSALRRTFPEAELDFCTDARYAPLFAGHPALTSVVPHRREEGSWALGRALRGRRYDVLIDLQHKVRTALLGRLARPRRRIAFVKRRPRDLLRSLRGAPLRVDAHAAELYVRALAPLGVGPLAAGERRLHIALAPQAEERAGSLLRSLGLGERPFVALAPGAVHATKRWGADKFAALAALLRSRGLGEPLAVGGPGDGEAVAATGVPSLPLDVDLPTLAAVLARARGLISGDSGPVHLAASVATPVVALYGPTDPKRWGPYGVPHEALSLGLPCAPCSDHGGKRCPLGTHACLRDLEPARVADALGALFAR
jgi:heptosyltransferase-2